MIFIHAFLLVGAALRASGGDSGELLAQVRVVTSSDKDDDMEVSVTTTSSSQPVDNSLEANNTLQRVDTTSRGVNTSVFHNTTSSTSIPILFSPFNATFLNTTSPNASRPLPHGGSTVEIQAGPPLQQITVQVDMEYNQTLPGTTNHTLPGATNQTLPETANHTLPGQTIPANTTANQSRFNLFLERLIANHSKATGTPPGHQLRMARSGGAYSRQPVIHRRETRNASCPCAPPVIVVDSFSGQRCPKPCVRTWFSDQLVLFIAFVVLVVYVVMLAIRMVWLDRRIGQLRDWYLETRQRLWQERGAASLPDLHHF